MLLMAQKIIQNKKHFVSRCNFSHLCGTMKEKLPKSLFEDGD